MGTRLWELIFSLGVFARAAFFRGRCLPSACGIGGRSIFA